MKQSRTTTLLIGAAAIVIVIAGLRSAAGIVGPVVLALSITIVFHPLRARLERRLPVWAASVVVLIAAYTLIVLMTLAMIVSVGQLAALVPTYAPQINDLVTGAGDWLAARGVGSAQVDAVAGAMDVGRVVDAATSAPVRRPVHPDGPVLPHHAAAVPCLRLRPGRAPPAERPAGTGRTSSTRWAPSRGAPAATSASRPSSA